MIFPFFYLCSCVSKQKPTFSRQKGDNVSYFSHIKMYGVFQYLCAICIPHCKDPIYVFPEMKLRGLIPTSHIHVSVSDKYIPRIGLPILLLVHECRNWKRGRAVSFLGTFVCNFPYSFFAVLLNRMGHFQEKDKRQWQSLSGSWRISWRKLVGDVGAG